MEARERRLREMEAIVAQIDRLVKEKDRLQREENAASASEQPSPEHPSTRQLVLDVEARLRQVENALIQLTHGIEMLGQLTRAVEMRTAGLSEEAWSTTPPSAPRTPLMPTSTGRSNPDLPLRHPRRSRRKT